MGHTVREVEAGMDNTSRITRNMHINIAIHCEGKGKPAATDADQEARGSDWMA